MKGYLRFIQRKTESLIRKYFVSRSDRGSGLGVLLRRVSRRFNIKQIIGVHLAGFAFFSAIILPQSHDALSSLEITFETNETVIAANTAPSTYQWPLKQFGISQNFSAFHPGMDLTDPLGTPIYPIGDGTVVWTQIQPYGYGHHILIKQDAGTESLYAHMSEIYVSAGDHVTKQTVLGMVGLTGHTTGSHLHFEIYVDGQATNPLDVLPLLKNALISN